MKQIKLSKGMYALVDDEDFDTLQNIKWFASFHGRNGTDKWYALASIGGDRIRMHRFIMGVPPGDKRVVHHLNDNSLDNRRENLEIVENNAANMAKCRNWRTFGKTF